MKKSFRTVILGMVLVLALLATSVGSVFAEEGDFTETYAYDFDQENLQESDSFEFSTANEFFLRDKAGANGVTSASFKTEGDNVFYRMKGYNALMSAWDVSDYPYVFSADLRFELIANQHVGFFVRGVMPGILKIENPNNNDIMQSFSYFETDWSAGAGIGGAGIYIRFFEDGMYAGVKTYTPDYLTVSEQRVPLRFPESYQVGAFNNFKFVENSNEEIAFYLNNELMVTFRMSDPGCQYGDPVDVYAYYGTVEILDPSGKVLKTVKDTRVNSDGSQVALASRWGTLDVDNLFVGIGGEGEIPVSSETAIPENTPEVIQSAAPETAETTAPAAADEGGLRTGGIIGIVAAAVVVAAAAVVAVLVIKKKKK